MALLSDFFIATPAEVQSLNIVRSPAKSFPSIQARAVEVVKLVQLQCILDGSVFKDHLKELDGLIIRSASDDGPWVITVPSIVTESLAQADEEKINRYGTAWASTEEWKLDNGKPGDVIVLTVFCKIK